MTWVPTVKNSGKHNVGARPLGSIIGGRYRVTGIRFDDGKLFEYPVVEFNIPEEEKAYQCPNPACGAVHWKAAEVGDYPARFCTECSAPMDVSSHPVLRLTEAVDPGVLGSAPEVAALGLIHGSIRAPIESSSELVDGRARAWIVENDVDPIPAKIERYQAVRWAAGLSAGLEALHQKGIFFNGQVTDACLGVSGDHAVWAHFASCSVAPETPPDARRADTRALAARLYQWLTGHEEVMQEPTFSPAMNAFFAQAAGQGFASAAELGQALENVLQDARAGMLVDYHTGRQTDVGKVRELNEDSLLTIETARFSAAYSRPGGIYVVADGMGGHSAGEVASGAIVDFLQGRCLAEMWPAMAGGANTDWLAWLKATVEAVNKHVFDIRKASGTDMGSTLVMAMLDGPRAYIAHVGDSRAYLVNSREIRRLTVDHSLVERLVATGQIRREEARYHPQKNVIYRTIGDKPRLDVDTCVVDLSIGDRLMLCSDGLCGLVLDEQMQKLVMGATNPQAACDALVSAAIAAGGDDNISVILIEIIRG